METVGHVIQSDAVISVVNIILVMSKPKDNFSTFSGMVF